MFVVTRARGVYVKQTVAAAAGVVTCHYGETHTFCETVIIATCDATRTCSYDDPATDRTSCVFAPVDVFRPFRTSSMPSRGVEMRRVAGKRRRVFFFFFKLASSTADDGAVRFRCSA